MDFFKNKDLLYAEMQEIIGCTELTHEIVLDYITPLWHYRKLLPWEHCGKSFQKPYGGTYSGGEIYLCSYEGKDYIFGIGLDEPEITEDMRKNGSWLCYTWAD